MSMSVYFFIIKLYVLYSWDYILALGRCFNSNGVVTVYSLIVTINLVVFCLNSYVPVCGGSTSTFASLTFMLFIFCLVRGLVYLLHQIPILLIVCSILVVFVRWFDAIFNLFFSLVDIYILEYATNVRFDIELLFSGTVRVAFNSPSYLAHVPAVNLIPVLLLVNLNFFFIFIWKPLTFGKRVTVFGRWFVEYVADVLGVRMCKITHICNADNFILFIIFDLISINAVIVHLYASNSKIKYRKAYHIKTMQAY